MEWGPFLALWAGGHGVLLMLAVGLRVFRGITGRGL